MISKNFKTHDALPTELDSKNTLIFVFYSKQNNSIKELQKKFPQSTIVGCSSAGEIFNNTIVDDVVISINKFETASFQVFYENICAGDSFSAGNTLAKKIYTPDLKGSLILSNGLKINGSQLISGLKEIISKMESAKFKNNLPFNVNMVLSSSGVISSTFTADII
jgi:hypothetical protein